MSVLLLLLWVSWICNAQIILPITRQHKSTHLTKRGAIHQSQLFNDEGSEYLVHIGIGTPQQHFSLSLDTGSSDMWVPSTSCPKSQCPLATFNPIQSITFQAQNTSFHVEYGIGKVDGEYARDHVYLGDAMVPDQLFGLAKSTVDLIMITSDNTTEIANGIFGLGFPSLTSSTVKYEPFLFQLAKRGLIDKAVFSISMTPNSGWSGELMLGGTNKEKYSGDITYAPVITNSSYWMVSGKGIQIMQVDTQEQILMHASFVRGMIIDTGTTLTYMDRELAEDIVRTVAGGTENVALDTMSGTYIVNCKAPHFHDPTVNYVLQFQLDKDIVLNVPVKDLLIPMDAKTINEATQCMFGIAPWMETGVSAKMREKSWILIGDSVLRSTYLVFDMDENQIGFAQAVHHMQSVRSLGDRLSPLKHGHILIMMLLVILVC